MSRDPLSCDRYTVVVYVKGDDRAALLACPAGVAFLAALEAARAAHKAEREADEAETGARMVYHKAVHAKILGTPEGAELTRLHQAAIATEEAMWPLGDAVVAAEHRESLDKLLGREVTSADAARAAYEAARQAHWEASAAHGAALKAVRAMCAAESEAAREARKADEAAWAALERAEEALQDAREALGGLVRVHW
jgi:hypothetical protein